MQLEQPGRLMDAHPLYWQALRIRPYNSTLYIPPAFTGRFHHPGGTLLPRRLHWNRRIYPCRLKVKTHMRLCL